MLWWDCWHGLALRLLSLLASGIRAACAGWGLLLWHGAGGAPGFEVRFASAVRHRRALRSVLQVL
eukprot:721320-Alexandrium_andersonii.AAC.1